MFRHEPHAEAVVWVEQSATHAVVSTIDDGLHPSYAMRLVNKPREPSYPPGQADADSQGYARARAGRWGHAPLLRRASGSKGGECNLTAPSSCLRHAPPTRALRGCACAPA